jgi:predicted esterase YcpF (UPF0227 family)
MPPAILYLHGFCSSPASWKVRLLSAALESRGQGDRLICPALSHVPNEAIAQAEALIAGHDGPLTLVGSSLGGYYATWLAERHDLRALLINPAVVAPLSLDTFIGRQTNLYTGESFDFSAEHIEELRALDVAQVTPDRYLLWVETGDEVLDYRQALTRYAGCRQRVIDGGDHSFVHFPDLLPQLFEYCGL